MNTNRQLYIAKLLELERILLEISDAWSSDPSAEVDATLAFIRLQRAINKIRTMLVTKA